jgi:NCS1 family nucleobase:cation symporter-1
MILKKIYIPIEKTHHSLITDGVYESEQTLAITKPFWVFLGGNTGIATWLIGVLVAGMGLDLADAMFVIVLGSLVGSTLPALTSIIGPKTGLSQIEASRFALGISGKKLPALLNWINAIGWDVINNVISATAFIVLLADYNIKIPMWGALAILVILQLVIGVYGHHLIQNTAKYTGSLLAVFFLIIGFIAISEIGFPIVVESASGSTQLVSAFILLVAYNLGWTTCTADYTRYLPNDTSGKNVFLVTFMALFLSLVVLAFFGYMTASAVTKQSPEGVMMALQTLSGHFSPLVLLLVWFTAIPANALNDNSAAYTLISFGFKFSRPTSAIFGAIIGYIISLFASESFVEFFEDFLFLFAHWVTPWAAIVLVHWFLYGKHSRYTPKGLTTGFYIMLTISAISISLFSVNPVYTGVAAQLIDNLDIGPYIGFILVSLSYFILLRLRIIRA